MIEVSEDAQHIFTCAQLELTELLAYAIGLSDEYDKHGASLVILDIAAITGDDVGVALAKRIMEDED
jgi:hypothetical protein